MVVCVMVVFVMMVYVMVVCLMMVCVLYRLQVVLEHFNIFCVGVITSDIPRQERRRVLQQFIAGALQVQRTLLQDLWLYLVLYCRYWCVLIHWLEEWTFLHAVVLSIMTLPHSTRHTYIEWVVQLVLEAKAKP